MAETKMQLADWLDDLCVRFIVNLPQEELESAERICFQVEEAQWFYEDFIRPLDPSLPSMSLRTFCMAIFRVCPLLSTFSAEHHLAAYSQFLAYKTRVPVRGAILLNDKMDHVLLVKGWKKGASWSFPRGKINKDERDFDCAIREVYEETGYDLAAAGLVPDESSVKSVEVTMREQHMKLYVFRDVPMGTVFQARTRKEISKITWWKLAQLPGYQKRKNKGQGQDAEDSGDAIKANKLYMVAPFLPQLKKWIAQQRKSDSHRRTTSDAYLSTGDLPVTDADVVVEDDLPSDVPAQNLAPMAYDFLTALPQMVSNNSAGTLPHGIPADAAAQMKRMLGVSDVVPEQSPQPPNQPRQQLPQHQVNLLSMLRQGSEAQKASAQENIARSIAASQRQYHESEQILRGYQQNQFMPPKPTAGPQMPHTQSQFQFPRSGHEHNAFQGGASLLQPSLGHNQPMAPNGPRTLQQSVPGARMPAQSNVPTTHNTPMDAPVMSHQGPAPYQRTGDPNFASRGVDTAQQPAIPRASELPMPKLNSHAMNLLSMFKGPSKQPNPNAHNAPALDQTPSDPVKAPGGVLAPSQSSAVAPQIEHSRTQSRRGSAKAAFGNLIPSTVSPSSLTGNARSPTPVRKRSEADTRQANLLNLFKPGSAAPKSSQVSEPKLHGTVPPSAPVAPQPQSAALLDLFKKTGGDKPAVKNAVPTENSAPPANNSKQLLQLLNPSSTPEPKATNVVPGAQSHRLPTQSTAQSSIQHTTANLQPVPQDRNGHKEKATSSPQVVPKVLQQPAREERPSQQRSKMPTQNVFRDASPADAHRTAGLKKPAPQTALQMAEKKVVSTPTTPIQILRRPTSSSAEQPAVKTTPQPAAQTASEITPRPTSHRSPRPAPKSTAQKTSSPSKAALNTASETPKKPFTPQILRRPQTETAAQQPQQQAARTSDHRPNAKDEQQTALLSLLNASKRNIVQSSTPAVRKSSSSAAHESPNASVPPSPGARMELSRSRISSVASPPSAEAPPRSRLNSAASVPRVGTPLRSATLESSGSQTPISPSDKGFLVNYLEGVIGKGSSK